MLSGTCAGVTGVGDCIRSGWSPYWLPPLAFANAVDGLLTSIDEIVCPFCITERAIGNIPGFNRPKANRVFALLEGFNCMQIGRGLPTPGHCHLFDFENEVIHFARAVAPEPTERGY